MKYILPFLFFVSTIGFGQQRVVFGETSQSRIFSMNPDGSDQQLLIAKVFPRDIMLDKNNKLIFTDEYNGRIMKMNVDGENLTVVLENLSNPTSLTLSDINSKIYWTEGKQIFNSGL